MAGARRFARPLALAGAGAALLAAGALVPPLRQPQAFHAFADQRALAGVPHAWNVLSNLPFLLVGAWGLLAVRRLPREACATAAERRALGVVFLCLVAVGAGSSYYHLAPDDARLFWDRLPLALLICALVGVVVHERAGALLGALLGLGAASVLVWRWTGDLRLYVLVQAGAMLAFTLLLVLRPARYDRGRDLAALVALYALAKATEAFDERIFRALGVLSGHTLKHLLAAAAMAIFLHHVKRRRLEAPPPSPRAP
jgi:hypothetical protein